MNKYKIIFLDIDGVMNSDQYNNYRYKHHLYNSNYGNKKVTDIFLIMY